MTLPFALSPIKPGEPIPYWVGNGFQIGQEFVKVLHYSINNFGWSDDLTVFHEEISGDNHFIDRASRNYAIQQLKKNILPKNPTILEIGCSSGFMLRRLIEEFPNANILGSDVVQNPLSKLAETLSNIALFRFDLVRCPLPDNSIDAIVMLNVLEHIEDDSTALRQVHRILKPGGALILEVPAGPNLYDLYDKVLMHFRRYTMRGLKKLVKQQGFEITRQSHLGCFLYPGFYLVKKNNKRFLNESYVVQRNLAEKQILNTAENKFFSAIMKLEMFFGKFITYPIGIRCTLSCIKKNKPHRE